MLVGVILCLNPKAVQSLAEDSVGSRSDSSPSLLFPSGIALLQLF